MAKIDDLDAMFKTLPIEQQLDMTEKARVRAVKSLLVLEDVILDGGDEILADAYAQIVAERERRDAFLADTPPWEDR